MVAKSSSDVIRGEMLELMRVYPIWRSLEERHGTLRALERGATARPHKNRYMRLLALPAQTTTDRVGQGFRASAKMLSFSRSRRSSSPTSGMLVFPGLTTATSVKPHDSRSRTNEVASYIHRWPRKPTRC